MTRQESFEQHYANQHEVPAETMAQYRWAEQDGYRLPGIAAAYRNYCAGWDDREIQAHAEIEDINLQALADASNAEYLETRGRT